MKFASANRLIRNVIGAIRPSATTPRMGDRREREGSQDVRREVDFMGGNLQVREQKAYRPAPE